jgi:hypothetical protein
MNTWSNPEGAVVIQHACKMGLGEDRLEAAGIALSIWAFYGLAQV